MIIGLVLATFSTGKALCVNMANGCCPPRDVHLSAGQMKARLRHKVPIQPPAFGKNVRVKGVVALVVGIDPHGGVLCIRLVSGHPLLVAPALESVKQWKLKAGVQPTCGKLVLALSTMEPDMGLKVLETEPTTGQRP